MPNKHRNSQGWVDWDALSKEACELRQMRMLRAFLKEEVQPFHPHYAESLAGVDLSMLKYKEDLQMLPFTSKRDLLGKKEDGSAAKNFVLQPQREVLLRRPASWWKLLRSGRSGLEAAMEARYRPILMTSTTGRSSMSVPFVFSAEDVTRLEECGRRIMEVGGSRRDLRHVNLFPYAPHLAFWQTHYAGLGFGTFCLSTGGGKVMDTGKTLAILKKVRPEILIGMPTFVYHLLREAGEEKSDLSFVQKVVLGGEKLPRGLRLKMRDMLLAMGAQDPSVLATYGFTEARMAWPECAMSEEKSGGSGFHLYPDFGLVEVIDPDSGEQVKEGEAGEIVFTTLQGAGSVVLRYRTGDLIEGGLVHENCPHCGRLLPRLVGRISRTSDETRLALDKVKGSLLNLNQVEYVLDDAVELGSWVLEIAKRDDDPWEVDELRLFIEGKRGEGGRRRCRRVRHIWDEHFEVGLNNVVLLSGSDIAKKQGLGRELKESKIVDRRKILEQRKETA